MVSGKSFEKEVLQASGSGKGLVLLQMFEES